MNLAISSTVMFFFASMLSYESIGKKLFIFLKFDWRLFFKIQDSRCHHFGKTILYLYIMVFLLPLFFKSSEHDVQRCPWTSYEAKTTKEVIFKNCTWPTRHHCRKVRYTWFPHMKFVSEKWNFENLKKKILITSKIFDKK